MARAKKQISARAYFSWVRYFQEKEAKQDKLEYYFAILTHELYLFRVCFLKFAGAKDVQADRKPTDFLLGPKPKIPKFKRKKVKVTPEMIAEVSRRARERHGFASRG